MTDAEIAKFAFQAYRDASLSVRVFQALRPAICPIAQLVSQLPPQARMLDVGCGAGLFLLTALSGRRIASGCGIDVNSGALNSARRASSALGFLPAEVTFLRSPVADLPDASFDVATLIDVMHHVPVAEQHEFFAAVSRKVKPGGMLMYKDMCQTPFWKAWANRLHDLLLARQWIHYVPIQKVAGWAAALGFSVVREERYSRYWYGHELLVLRRP